MSVAPYIIQRARQLGLDPAAVIAVARGEGGLQNRAGDIGDTAGGGSYGPFQLYAQGRLPARYRGNPRAADAWAWSPAGIDYALTQMAPYGRGKRGAAAVSSIISGFEKPADPRTSIANAVARLGSSQGVGSGGPGALPPVFPGNPGVDRRQARAQFASQLIQAFRADSPEAMMGAILGFRKALEAGDPQQAAQYLPLVTRGPQGGKQGLLEAIEMARRLGLHVGENPLAGDPVDPVHVRNSLHYSDRAIDVSGPLAKRQAFSRWAMRRFGGSITELFDDTLGLGVKRGRQIGAIGNHGDHVHLGF